MRFAFSHRNNFKSFLNFKTTYFFQFVSCEICCIFLRCKNNSYVTFILQLTRWIFYEVCLFLLLLLDIFFRLQKLFCAVNEVPMQTNVTNIKLANRIQQTAQVINIICFGTVTFPSGTLSSLLGTSICFQLL